jgi:hypothetical protein
VLLDFASKRGKHSGRDARGPSRSIDCFLLTAHRPLPFAILIPQPLHLFGKLERNSLCISGRAGQGVLSVNSLGLMQWR